MERIVIHFFSNVFEETNWKSSVENKRNFCSSAFLIETESIFEQGIFGSEFYFVLQAIEVWESKIFWSGQSETETEKGTAVENIANEIDEIRQLLRLSGGSSFEGSSSAPGSTSKDGIRIDDSVSIIGPDDFMHRESLTEVIFSSSDHLREINGFCECRSLCRIEIPSSVEAIGTDGFYGCISLNEVVFSSDSHLIKIDGFRKCTSLCRIEIPSSVEVIQS
jgi:hypothetical protein